MKKSKKNIDYYKEIETVSERFKDEPRACCYAHAIKLINEAKKEKNVYENDKTVDAIIILMFCWNFAATITKSLTRDKIKNVLNSNKKNLIKLENLSITELNESHKKEILKIFGSFKKVFGQTGASKALSLLNPKLFVMWDTKIRSELKKNIKGIKNGEKSLYFFKFLLGIKKIINEKNLTSKVNRNEIAKKIDECHYTEIVMKRKNVTSGS